MIEALVIGVLAALAATTVLLGAWAAGHIAAWQIRRMIRAELAKDRPRRAAE